MNKIYLLWFLFFLVKAAQAFEISSLKIGIKAKNHPFTESIVYPETLKDKIDASQLKIAFENTLEKDGSVLWLIDNHSDQEISALEVITYIDIEIDQVRQTFFNETAKLVSLSLPKQPQLINGYIPSPPNSWQIDEPGYRGGRLNSAYQHANLRHFNALATVADDVAVAFQHSIPMLKKGERIYLRAQIGDASINGIKQSALNSSLSYYLNSTVYTPRPLIAPIVEIIAPITTLTTTETVKAITDSKIRVTDDEGVLVEEVVIDTATTAGYQDFSCQQTTVKQVDCTIVITGTGDLWVSATDSDNLSGQASQDYVILPFSNGVKPVPAVNLWALLVLVFVMVTSVIYKRKAHLAHHLLVIGCLVILTSFSANAGRLTGGDAISQEAADIVLDLVFISDTSGSMSSELQAISETMPKVVEQLSCPQKDIWVRSRYMGLTSQGRGLFDETLNQVLPSSQIKHLSIDDFHIGVDNVATHYPYNDDTRADQGYVKAVVTIGDGGSTTTANNHLRTYEANRAAIANDVIVFSVLSSYPYAGTEKAMTALSQGGLLPPMQMGERPFQLLDTKGTLSKISDNHLREDLETLICGVAKRYRKPLCQSQLSVREKFGKVQVIAENDNSNEGYGLYRGTQLNGAAVKVAVFSKELKYYLDKDVQSSTNYYYQLKKENAEGEVLCESPVVSAFVPEYISKANFNLAPIFTSQPQAEIKVGQSFNYRLAAKDFDGDSFSFKLLSAPASARLNHDYLQWTANFQESSEFTVKVTDSKGANRIQNFVLKVNNIGDANGGVNTAPVITSVPFLSGIYGNPYRYQLTAGDIDGDQVYYYFLNKVPAGMSIDHTTGLITWLSPQKGSYLIEVAATDFTADTVQKFTLTVYEQSYNQPPQITSQAVTTGETNKAYHYQVTAQDPESKPLTYAFDEFAVIPSGMVVDRTTGLITWLSPRAGQYLIKWYVTDGINVVTQSYTLTITQPTNIPPKITSRAVDTAKIGQPYRYQVVAEDPDTAVLNYSLNGQIPKGLHIDKNGLLTWDYPLLGSYPITITVDDGQSIVVQKYTLRVQKTSNTTSRYVPEFIGQPPVLAQEGRRYSYYPQVFDLDNNILSYSLVASPPGMTIRNSDGSIRWEKPILGKHSITLAVTDGTHTAEQTFNLTVLPKPQSGNEPPVISSQADRQATTEEAYRYQVVANDPENNPLLYTVGGYKTPIGVTIDSKTGLLIWQKPTAGYHHLQILVSDGENVVSQRWAVNITQPTTINQPPEFTTTPPTETAVGEDYFYQAKATDPEGKPVTYYLNGTVPTKLNLDRKTGLITWKNISPGYYYFQLIASDGEKMTTQWISIQPSNNNKAPIFTSTPIVTGSEDSPYHYQATAVDPEKKAIKYSLSGRIPSGMQIDENKGKIVWAKPKTGTYQITVEAADDYQIATQTYQLVITQVAINKPPVFISNPKTTTQINQTYHYQAIAKDPEGNKVRFNLKQSPSGMTMTNSGKVQWVPTNAGDYLVIIVANDGSQRTEQKFTVTVNKPKPADATLVKAANWIKSQIQSGGEVIAKTRLSTPYQATDEAVQATALINQPITPTHVNQYLLTEDIWLAEHLARQAIYQQSTGHSFTPTLTTLRQHYQATTGSYSSFIDESGNLLDTAYVLIAQAKTNKDMMVLGYVVNYLKSEQLGNGSYRLPNNDSSLYVTAKVLQALNSYTNYPVSDNIAKAKDYLLTRLQQDHTTLADWELAQTLLALYDVVTDKSPLSAYVSNLKQRQLSNGSFAGDVYSTALAIKAIYYFEQ